MEVRNCKRCGRVFQYINTMICPLCLEKEQEDFNIVREYLSKHPNAMAIQIAEETEVDISTINRFLREGRLECDSIGDSGLTCERCGTSITSGKYCNKCVNELQRGLMQASSQLQSRSQQNRPSSSTGSKIHTYDNILRKK